MATVTDLAELLLADRPNGGARDGGAYVIGLTGGVACGKTTLAASLVDAFAPGGTGRRVECVGTDGFLHPNAVLIERGILDRKGFPESYDRDALHAALERIRSTPAAFPAYSHIIYDVDPASSRTIAPPDVLIVEGLGLDRAAPVDTLIYLDAAEADQEAWFVARFMAFWEIGRRDAASFYARFRDLDAEAAAELGARVWISINRPNLREHIAPVRDVADVVVTKGADHAITSITRRRTAKAGL
jgi:type I pantothenate kinase